MPPIDMYSMVRGRSFSSEERNSSSGSMEFYWNVSSPFRVKSSILTKGRRCKKDDDDNNATNNRDYYYDDSIDTNAPSMTMVYTDDSASSDNGSENGVDHYDIHHSSSSSFSSSEKMNGSYRTFYDMIDNEQEHDTTMGPPMVATNGEWMDDHCHGQDGLPPDNNPITGGSRFIDTDRVVEGDLKSSLSTTAKQIWNGQARRLTARRKLKME